AAMPHHFLAQETAHPMGSYVIMESASVARSSATEITIVGIFLTNATAKTAHPASSNAITE
ncbi:unnamed protein product, partial [Allacma fusca]